MTIIDKSNILKNTEKREIERQLINSVETIKGDFSLNLNNELSNLINIQQEYIQNIRKFNLILTKTDGSLTSDNKALTYNLSADTTSGDTFNLLKDSYTKIKDKHTTFFNEPSNIIQNDSLLFLAKDKYLPKDTLFNDSRTGQPSWVKSDSNTTNDDTKNRFYQIMAQIFYDEIKRNALKEFISNSQVYSNKTAVNTEIDKAINECVKIYNDYTKSNIEIYGRIKETKAYKDLIVSPLNESDKYIFNYVTTNSGTNEQNSRISDLYSTNNLNNDFKTFDGKIKFN